MAANRIGKVVITKGMMRNAHNTVNKVLKSLNILDVKHEREQMIYTATSKSFDPIPERNSVPFYEFNIVNEKLVMERKRS